MMAKLLAAILALVLSTASAFAAAGEADSRLLDQIKSLVDRADEKMSPDELLRLHKYITEAEGQVSKSWEAASLGEINASRTGELWKKGNDAIVRQMQRQAATTTGTLGFLPSGKSFMDDAFDPRSSDFDATVLGPRSTQGAENFAKAAPGDFLYKRKFTVMSAEGNFYRYRGGADTATRTMTQEQFAAARNKAATQMTAAAEAGGGYLSRGSVADLEAQIAAGKYGGKVTFYSSAGVHMGEMPLSRLGSMSERFGIVETHLGDVLGMAADRNAQLANYKAQKGGVAGSAKVLQRQAEVIERLSPDMRAELLAKQPGLAQALKDADAIAADIKNGTLAADAVAKLNLTPAAFARRAQEISESIVQAAGKDLVQTLGSGAAAGARNGARLMLEQNVLGAIVNAGGVDKFRAQQRGNAALLAMVDEIEKGYGVSTVTDLATRRGAALASGLEAAARNAGIPQKALVEILESGAGTARLATKSARGAMADLVGGMGIDAAIAVYLYSHGDHAEAARTLVEGGIAYALPEAALAVLVRDVVKVGMEFAIDKAIGPYKARRLDDTWKVIQSSITDIIANQVDKDGKFVDKDGLIGTITGAQKPEDLLPRMEEFLQDTSGTVNWHNLDPGLQMELAQLVFRIRGDVKATLDERIAFQTYMKNKAYNRQWEIEDEAKLLRKIDVSLKSDDERRATAADKERDGKGSKPRALDDQPKPPVRQTPPVTPPKPQTQQQADRTPQKSRAGDNAPTVPAPVQPQAQPQVPTQPSTLQSPTPQKTGPSIISREIEEEKAKQQQAVAAENARLDGLCKCYFETTYQNECVVDAAKARQQSKEYEGRCESKVPPSYDPQTRRCVGTFVVYYKFHSYDDMKSYLVGWGQGRWSASFMPTNCGTRRG